jgi:uncharacterized protein
VKRGASKQAPTRFDALKLAAHGERIAGEVDATGLPRIADQVVQSTGAGKARIDWSIVGGRDAQGRPQLTLDLDGALFVACQRCLRPMAVPVVQQTELLLARDEADLARLDVDEREVVLATAPLDALTLVEDELLLSLPFAPCHAGNECAAIASAPPASQTTTSPFAGLAALKSGSRSRN